MKQIVKLQEAVQKAIEVKKELEREVGNIKVYALTAGFEIDWETGKVTQLAKQRTTTEQTSYEYSGLNINKQKQE